ncbi:hypothetical protein [Planococcus shixiaomingii]|uniref:hypothetical protein n=1 Tax=Planococcus shixiaomingii TaxID=3058393 RepID=UPI0026264E88|nr:hypothetical protein [Planococcus sp. N022]WKA55600.1 hypothetical protein QWY21_04215 [Planococcus sp. N022]
MAETLRKIELKTAAYMALLFYSLTILLHVFIISGIIPVGWINGGRSESIAEQLPISIFNTIIAIIGGLFTLTIIGFTSSKFKRTITVICWIFVGLWSIGFLQQLLGTTFEKTVCSLLLLLGVISNLRIAIEKRK